MCCRERNCNLKYCLKLFILLHVAVYDCAVLPPTVNLHSLSVIWLFYYYVIICNVLLLLCRVHSLRRVVQSEKYFKELSKRHQQLLPGFCDHLSSLRTCIEHNYEVIKLIVADADHMFENRLDYFSTVSIVVFHILCCLSRSVLPLVL